MGRIEIPGGPGQPQVFRVTEPDPVQAQIIQLLVGISNQLDLLVRMECGQRSRKSVATQISELEAAYRARQNGGEPPSPTT